MVQQHRGNQQQRRPPVAGPSSPPKAPKASQPQSRQPRRSEVPEGPDLSAYGYGASSEFSNRRPTRPRANGVQVNGSRMPNGAVAAASTSNGHYGYAHASTSRQPTYGNQFYAMSAPLPPNGPPLPPPPPLPPQAAFQAMPALPTGPKSSNLQTQNSIRIATPVERTSFTPPRPPSSTASSIPPPPSTRRQTPPPPPPSMPSSATSSSSSSRSRPNPLASTSAIPPSAPSAPRAMRFSADINPLKGKGPLTSSSSFNGSLTPTTEDLARAALSKTALASSSSSAPQPKPSSSSIGISLNGTASTTQARKTLKIAISKPGGPQVVKKQAFVVLASSSSASSSKAQSSSKPKHVNVLEAKEKELEKIRLDEEAARAAEELIAEARALEVSSVKKEEVVEEEDDKAEDKESVVTGPRYTPPPRSKALRNKPSRWEPADPEDDMFDTSTMQVPEPSAQPPQRSHTPPQPSRPTHDRGYTPPPRSRQSISPPKPISLPSTVPLTTSLVDPPAPPGISATPPPPPPPRSAMPVPPPSIPRSTHTTEIPVPSSIPAEPTQLNAQRERTPPPPTPPSVPTPASPNTPAERSNSSLFQKPKPKAASISFSLAPSTRPRTDTIVKKRNLLFDDNVVTPTQAIEEVKQPAEPVATAPEDVNMLDDPLPDRTAAPALNMAQTLPAPIMQEASTSESMHLKPQPVAPQPAPVNWLAVQADSKTQSGKLLKRENGKGVARPVLDPRGSETEYGSRLSELIRTKKIHIRARLEPIKYTFDEYSCGRPPPPPPSSILVTNLSRLVTSDKIRTHFAQYGEISDFEYCCDTLTGGFLGLCRVTYVDETIRTKYIPGKPARQVGEAGKQDGHVCAKLAIQRSHRQKIWTLASNQDGIYDALRVVFDPEGELCKREVKTALDIKHNRVKPPQEPKPAALPRVQAPPPLIAASPVHDKAAPSNPPLARRVPLPAGDKFLPRTTTEDRSDRAQSVHSSPGKASSRAPPRLQPPPRKYVDSYVPSNRRRYSDHSRSGSDSETASNADSEDTARRRKEDEDRIYDYRSRVTRKPAPPVKKAVMSKEDAYHISAMRQLAAQHYPYIWIEKKELEHTSNVHELAVRNHFRGGQEPKILQILADLKRWYITFQSQNAARRCYQVSATKPFGNVPITLHVEDPPSRRDVDELVAAAHARADKEAERLAEEAIAVSSRHVKSMTRASDSAKSSQDRLSMQEVVRQAKNLIMMELKDSFKADLKTRLATPYVTAAWNKRENDQKSQNSTSQSTCTEKGQVQPNKQAASAISQETLEDTLHTQPSHTTHMSSELGDEEASLGIGQRVLPSFGKQEMLQGRDARSAARAHASKRQSQTPVPQIQSNVAGDRGDVASLESYAQNHSTPNEPDDTGGTKAALVDDPSPAKLRSEAEAAKKSRSPRKPVKSKKSKVIEVLHFTSSEEDSDEEDIPLSKMLQPISGSNKPVEKAVDTYDDEMSVKVEEIQVEEETVLLVPSREAEDTAPLEAVIHLPTPAPSDSIASSTKRELSESLVEEPAKRPRLASSVPPEAVFPPAVEPIASEEPSAPAKRQPPVRKAPTRGRGKGKRVGKQRKKASATPVPDIDPLADFLTGLDQEDMFYLRLALQRQKAGLPLPPTDLPEEEEEDEDIQVVEPRHETGCARTEGYYKIPQAEKLRYLLARNQGKTEPNKEGNSSLSVSRLARVNARHLASGLDKHKKATATDTDLLQLNQLRTRKKQLRFARSPIHDWGLYALEHIPAGEMVIEYVGEQIRQQVADKREKAYERQGIGSSYLFRVDDDVVIDATMKGNLGRLINHCCTPNCTAKILSVGNSKKIVIYAKQVINKGDEITYDYHFPIEDEKIVCLCGSSGCRGFLN